MNVLLYIAAFVFVISVFLFLGVPALILCAGRRKKCTRKGTATLIQVITGDRRDAPLSYEIEYTCDGIVHRVIVSDAFAEGVSTRTPAGTQVPIRYDPDKPERVIIGEDPSVTKTVKSWKRTWKRSLIWMLLSLGVILLVFSRQEKSPELSLTTTTIGQFSQELSALAERQPDKLTFTESIGSPGTFSVVVDDPAMAKKALNVILSASVSKMGCQVDMAQYRYEEYCFSFGNETFTFSFIPHSYFCYNGQDYELRENRLRALCDDLHEMAAEAEAAQWYGDDALLQTRFVDNGDEARSVTELTLSAGEETLMGIIEGAYDVLSIEKQPDGYVICYTYGDFYSHDTIRSSFVTVENGEMIITEIAQ